jgi:hypothetical protein
MIPQGERKQKSNAAMASINLDLVATTLLRIAGELRSPTVTVLLLAGDWTGSVANSNYASGLRDGACGK